MDAAFSAEQKRDVIRNICVHRTYVLATWEQVKIENSETRVVTAHEVSH
jgi:hypothetical protein